DTALQRQDAEQYPDDYQRERAVRFNCTQRAIGTATQNHEKKILNHPPTDENKHTRSLAQ
ncbi:hypothetical protein, partial [Neisseria iguanae]|uniref:hypothetical protein n=1 Tax=Neisseria iguanae TaxID=90242 RepID=UPI001FE394ED